MTPEQAIQHVRLHAARVPEQQQEEWLLVAALIESLQSERDALAEQLRVMREALSEAHGRLAITSVDLAHSLKPYAEGIEEAERTCIKALALTPTAAEARAKANAEKAEKWDTWCDEFHTNYKLRADDPYFMLGVVLSDQDRRDKRAEANAEKAKLLDRATRFKVGKRKGYDVTVETREGHDGPKWAVFDGCFVLNMDGQWEYEPLPSSRTEEFLGRTRFDSLTDALRAAREASDVD